MSESEKAIRWQWKAWHELTLKELEAMLALRQSVFIIEQNCPYPDIDGKDDQAVHLMGWLNHKLVATLRVFPKYEPYDNKSSLGRVCTHMDVRRFGMGRTMMQQAVDFIDEHYPEQATQIGAQHYLKRFYESFGFEQCSEPYDEDGIEHILMLRAAHRG